MYIDRNNLQYLRKHYKQADMTDEEALSAYAHDKQPQGYAGLLTKEPARLHNKLPVSSSYENFISGRENKKRVVNGQFHSEFIIDPKGNFVSQWNVLKVREDGTIESDPKKYQYTDEFRQQILNGESFNYANNKGNEHDTLDSNPPEKFDHTIRKEAKKGWRSPNEREFDYIKDKKSKDNYSE